jgi:hypothetical protein
MRSEKLSCKGFSCIAKGLAGISVLAAMALHHCSTLRLHGDNS